MTDPGSDDLTPFERRLRDMLAEELAQAERDFRAPPPRAPRRVAASAVVAAVAVIVVAAVVVTMLAIGADRATPPPPSSPPLASPSRAADASPSMVEPSATPFIWPGRVVATFVSVPDAIAYDSGRGVVWIRVTVTTGTDHLYRYEVDSGRTARWDLPETTYFGMFAQVVIDDSGAVWVYGDGYRVVRLEPDTGTVTSHLFPLEVPGVDWADGGTWVSAIAADGDGVLVARDRVPYLERLGPDLTVTERIDLPDGFAGATGLAASVDHLFITADGSGAVARFSRDGRVEATFSSVADRLERHGSGVIARHDWSRGVGDGEILDVDGSTIGRVAPPFTLPPGHGTVTSPLGQDVPVTLKVEPSAVVDDGRGTSWYLVAGEPTLREYVADR